MVRSTSFAIAILLLTIGSESLASISLDLDESTFRSAGGTSYLVDVVIRVDDVGDPDLTTMTQANSVISLFQFATLQTDVMLVGVTAPSTGSLFTNASHGGGGSPNDYIFASVTSNAPASDPFLDNGNLLTLQLDVAASFSGTFSIDVLPIDTIFGSGPSTFITDSGGGNIPFDSLSGGTFTVSAVPEPSSLVALVSLCGLGLLRRRRCTV